MKKVYFLALVAFVAVLGTTQSRGSDIPVMNFIPDVIMGDLNPSDGQTADGYYIYSGLNIRSYIWDEEADKGLETIRAAFFVDKAEAANLSIGGKSGLTDAQVVDLEATGAMPNPSGANPEWKDILADGSVLRLTSDLNDPVGPDVALLGQSGNFGPQYGLNGVTKSLVEVIATDGSTAAKGNFWVTQQPAIDDAASALDTADVGGTPLLTDQITTNPRLTFTFASPNAADQSGNNFNAVNSQISNDAVYMDSRGELETNRRIGFGVWQNTNVSYGPNWIDGLVKVSWTLSNTAISSSVPGFRSRIRPGDTSQHLPFKTLFSTLSDDPQNTFYGNAAQMANGKQMELRHYYYGGNFPALLAYKGALWVALDLVDYSSTIGAKRAVAGLLQIDRMMYEILRKPGDSDVANIYSQSGAGLGAVGAEWDGSSYTNLQIDVLPNSGVFSFASGAAGLTATMTGGATRIYGALFRNFTGILLDSTEGQTVRLKATIKDNRVSTASAAVDMRIRLFPSYTEQFNILQIPGYYAQASTPTLVVPATGAGTDYEIFMDSPVVDPNQSVQFPRYWVVAFDFINWYSPQAGIAPYDQIAAYPRSECDFTITALRFDRLLK